MNPPRDAAAAPDDAPEPEGLGHVLKSTLSQCYDYFHLTILGSLMLALALVVPTLASAIGGGTLLSVLLYYLVGALAVGPAWVALYGMSEGMSQRELPAFGAYFASLRRFYWRSAGLFLAYVFILGGIALAVWFYQWKFDHFILEAISLLWLYIGIAWVIVGLYVPAFLVRDDGTVLSALKKGVILALAHPGYSFLVLAQVLCVVAVIALPFAFRASAAMGVSFILAFLFLPGFTALLATNAVEDLLNKHRAAEEDEEEVEDQEKAPAEQTD